MRGWAMWLHVIIIVRWISSTIRHVWRRHHVHVMMGRLVIPIARRFENRSVGGEGGSVGGERGTV